MEPRATAPRFLGLVAWEVDGQRFEIASRQKLDSRVVLPFFSRDGELFAGLLERARPSRGLRGAPLVGLEAIGFDFSGVDETGDIRSYGRAMFTARAAVEVDETRPPIALPSMARSIGYLTELTLPLLQPVAPPKADEVDVTWDGARHRILFRPVKEWIRLLLSPEAPPCGEEVLTLLRALGPPVHDPQRLDGSRDGDAFVHRERERVWSADRLAASLAESRATASGGRLTGDASGDLRFLRFTRVDHEGHAIELVTPATGVSVSMLPYVVADGTAYFVLWHETRAAALERRARQPLYDLPVPVRYVNATGFFVSPDEAKLLEGDPIALANELLARAFGGRVAVRIAESLGPAAEPASSVSTELRHRLACALDASSIGALPPDALLISADELALAVSRGLVKDPVIVSGLLHLAGRLRVDPFARARDGAGDERTRAAFVDKMTEGSIVQRRLKGYSSIENEQLQAPTYRRLMTLLQHEFGLRIAFPRADKDRTFFKAAYRVFMAADRGEDRALQGLHFSHDAFHFALGNFTPAPPADFDEWYASGAPAPAEVKPEGKDWDVFSKALKHAENEATFFSFWTLYDEHLPLARHVGKLTFFEAMRDLGITDRAAAWSVYLDVVHEAVLPDVIRNHPVYRERKDVSGLFDYMLGFRDYHYKDIAIAWRFAVKEPYRGYTTRFGVYEHDLARYLANVHSFSLRLASYPPGLNPLHAACADVRVDLSLRVWDVIKALKLLRAASITAAAPAQVEERRGFLLLAEQIMSALEAKRAQLTVLRGAIGNAEITPDNEETFAKIAALGTHVERIRQDLWDRVGRTGLLQEAVIAEERTRELPR